jgi:hypothetical protein
MIGGEMESMTLDVGLADSKLATYTKLGSGLTVVVKAWNEREIKFAFQDVILVRDRCASEFADIKKGATPGDEALSMAIAIAYESAPSNHPYSVYAFLNADDVRTLEIVAAECRVTLG